MLNEAVKGIFSPVKSTIISVQDIRSLLQGNLIGTILFTHFQQQDKYIELLFKRQNHYILGEQIKKEFLLLISKDAKNKPANFGTLQILLEYQISAVLGVINYWFQKGKPVSEHEILQKIYEISSNGVLKSLQAELSNANDNTI